METRRLMGVFWGESGWEGGEVGACRDTLTVAFG